MCACPRDKVIETYVGVRTLQEREVLMCSCVGVWGIERLLYVCVGGDEGGCWLQIKSEVSIFEGF